MEAGIIMSSSPRRKVLDPYDILDSVYEEDYDNITFLAASICNTPISLISLIDDKRQWFKSHHGLRVRETPVQYAFCKDAIHQDEPFVVNNTLEHVLYRNNPLVTGYPEIRFYAGIPLINAKGEGLGTLCVIDRKPRNITKDQIKALEILAKNSLELIESRKIKKLWTAKSKEFIETQKVLEEFAIHTAHDLKAPLVNISSLANQAKKRESFKDDEKGSQIIQHIEKNANRLSEYISSLMDYAQITNSIDQKKGLITRNQLELEILNFFKADVNTLFNVECEPDFLNIDRTPILQILINLITNAIKHNPRESRLVEVKIEASETEYLFHVIDNGPGFSREPKKILKSAFRFSKIGSNGHSRTGLGLGLVDRLIRKMGGKLNIKSSKLGSHIWFNIPK